MKNILKFILRMAVAACIVVGAVALVMHFTNNDSKTLAIVNASTELNISEKLDKSHQNFKTIVEQNNQKTFDGNKANASVVGAVVLVNDVLEEYYDYYITLTCYENAEDSNLKDNILNNINSLNEKINKTTEFLTQLNSASSSNPKEKNSRAVNLFNALCNQTETLFETCTLLKQYVYGVNYQSDIYTSKTETVLEMAKDYAKVVFNKEIKSNVYATKSITLISDVTATGFTKIAQKTINMGRETASQVEVNFIYSYGKIDKSYLNELYACSSAEKTLYISSLSNFMGEAPEQETPEQLEERTAKAQQQKTYLNHVYSFMVTTF